jgi:diacylglycerol kinase family enzyme
MLFIINPRAGKSKSLTPLLHSAAHFSDAGWLLRVCFTQSRGHARDLAAQCGADFDAVVCAGGDGTLNETISGLMTLPQRPAIGYIPFGSTNDFAASLRLPAQPEEAAKLIANVRPVRWISAYTTTGTSPMWHPSAPSPARPTPRHRAPKTRWVTLRIFWRG